MANTTIDQLSSLTGTAVANNDLFLVYDASANTEKQISATELKNLIGNGTFTVNTADTSDAIVVTSTDSGATAAPDIVFFRNSSSPAASDNIGNVVFRGKNSVAANKDYAAIFTTIASPTSSSESGVMTLNTMSGGTLSERMRISSTGAIGIGTTSPVQTLTVQRPSANGTSIALNVNNPYGYGVGVGTAAVGIRFNRSPNDAGTTGVMADIYAGNETETTSTSGYLALATRTGASEVTTERVRINSAGNVGIGTTTPTARLHVSGQIAGGYTAHSAGTLAMALGTNVVVRVTPNATATYTTTVAPAGSRASIIILTSGTTSYTITFGTGFVTTGTLATGTVTGKYFVINFVSDGTSMIEAGRTVAM